MKYVLFHLLVILLFYGCNHEYVAQVNYCRYIYNERLDSENSNSVYIELTYLKGTALEHRGGWGYPSVDKPSGFANVGSGFPISINLTGNLKMIRQNGTIAYNKERELNREEGNEMVYNKKYDLITDFNGKVVYSITTSKPYLIIMSCWQSTELNEVLNRQNSNLETFDGRMSVYCDQCDYTDHLNFNSGNEELFKVVDIRKAAETYIQNKVDNYINEFPSCKTVSFDIMDIDSHYPIQYADITILSTAPTYDKSFGNRLGLLLDSLAFLERYACFDRDKEFVQAIQRIPSNKRYLIGENKFVSYMSPISIILYYPLEYTIEVRHPNYSYVKQKLNVTNGTNSFSVFMSALDKKVRVKIENK